MIDKILRLLVTLIVAALAAIFVHWIASYIGAPYIVSVLLAILAGVCAAVVIWRSTWPKW